jgi:hypothetical protein
MTSDDTTNERERIRCLASTMATSPGCPPDALLAYTKLLDAIDEGYVAHCGPEDFKPRTQGAAPERAESCRDDPPDPLEDRGWTFFFEVGWPPLWRPHVNRSARMLRLAWGPFSVGVVQVPAQTAIAFCMWRDPAPKAGPR